MNRRVTLGVRTSWLVLAACVFAAPLSVAGQSLPSGWSTSDVGSVGASGSASGSGGSFSVRGAGADIWGTEDGFRFVYRQMTGDGEIVTRVNSLDYVHAWTKAGVMMRESLGAGARHAFMLTSPGKGTAFQRRPYPGGETYNNGAGGGPGYFLKLTRSSNNFEAYVSGDGSSWYWVGSEWIDMPSTIYVGVAVTSHYYGALAGATFSDTAVYAASAAPAGGGLPAGWSAGDVGSVAAGGWAEGSGSDVRLHGSGADIWEHRDGFHFMYRALQGDGSITARVTGLDYTHEWAKAGVMMRESLSGSAAHAFMMVSAGQGTGFQRRTSAGGASSHSDGPWGQAPHFVKLTRAGGTFTAYTSYDGSNWSWVGSEYIGMGSTIYVGVAVTSHADGAIAGANFSHLEVVQGSVAPPQQEAAPAPEPEPVYQEPAPSYGGGSGGQLRLLQWNTKHGGTGTDGVLDPARLARWIAYMNPDVASLNEVDGDWHLEPILAYLQAYTGVTWYSSFAGVGNVIVSRIPFTHTSVCNYNDSYPRNAAHARINVGGRPIDIFSVHLDASSTDVRAWEVSNTIGCANNWGGAAIIAGDFNMQASSYEYQVASANGYTDAWLSAKYSGTTQNYSGNCDGCTRNSRIDYVFSSPGAWYARVASAQVFDTRDGNGYMPSDHKPLLVTYVID